jgi:hypothetical protein
LLANGVCRSPLRWLKNGFASKPAPTVFAHDKGNRRLHEISRNRLAGERCLSFTTAVAEEWIRQQAGSYGYVNEPA